MDAVNSLLRLAVVLAVFAGLEARAQNDVPAREPGTQQKEAGEVSFPVSCGPAAQQEFDHAMARFHSPWYAQSIQPFTGLARKYPNCGMVYWGIALSILHNPPRWASHVGDGLEGRPGGGGESIIHGAPYRARARLRRGYRSVLQGRESP